MEAVINVPDGSPAADQDARLRQRPLRVSARLHGVTVGALARNAAMLGLALGLLVFGVLNLNATLGWFLLLFSPVVIVVWGCLFGETLTAVLDRMRPQPVLIIDDDGLFDRRQTPAPVPWSAVARAQPVVRSPHPGVSGVLLTLRQAIEARHNPLRFGVRGFRWRRQANELYVPLVSLDAQKDALARIILDQVRQHGGAIDPPTD